MMRVRSFLIFCFPALVAAAFCILGNCSEVDDSTSESSPIADSSSFPDLATVVLEHTDLGFALDTRMQLGREIVFEGRDQRVKSHELPDRAMAQVVRSLFELARFEQLVRESRSAATSLAVVAPPIHPHAPPVRVS